MSASVVWVTPDAEKLLGYIARVSNPKASPDDDAEKLIRYLIRHKHWSPFEMVSACVEVNTTRTIARQLLRHRSFSFQEFSQRYAEVADTPVFTAPRLQDAANRQNSIPTDDPEIAKDWYTAQYVAWGYAHTAYKNALNSGVAKELARSLLPEGMSPSKLYVSGTLRSWLHYLDVRSGKGTQLEHIELANDIRNALLPHFPTVLSIDINE